MVVLHASLEVASPLVRLRLFLTGTPLALQQSLIVSARGNLVGDDLGSLLHFLVDLFEFADLLAATTCLKQSPIHDLDVSHRFQLGTQLTQEAPREVNELRSMSSVDG